MGQKRPFFWPKIGFFCPVMDWQRPPPPILRVPDTRKNVPGANNLIKTNFCSPSSPKFDIFRQKWAKKGHFLAENRFFFSVGDWQRPPPPILRVPNTEKHFLASRKVIQTNFCSLSSPKSAIFCQKCAKICHFLARNRFFRPGGDFQDPPPPISRVPDATKTRHRSKGMHMDQFWQPLSAKMSHFSSKISQN